MVLKQNRRRGNLLFELVESVLTLLRKACISLNLPNPGKVRVQSVPSAYEEGGMSALARTRSIHYGVRATQA